MKATIREALRRSNIKSSDLTDVQRERAESVSSGEPELKGKAAVEFIMADVQRPEHTDNGDSPDLLATTKQIAQATKLEGADAVITAASGREAKVMFDGRALAFISLNRKGIRVHVQHRSKPQYRETVETVAGAAELVLTSERRAPKQAS